VEIDLPFCGQFAIGLNWAAVKNQGEDWVYLTVTAGRASFTATSTFTVAYGNSQNTRVYSATANELRDISCFPSRPPEAKYLVGSVRDVPADERYYVTVGSMSVSSTPFTVFVPDGPLDVVARTQNTTTGLPRRIIVRHGVDLPVGSEIPILDFLSTEPRAFESANLTVNGVGGSAFFSNEFVMPAVRHGLASGLATQSPIRYYAVPSSLLGADDYHTVNVRAVSNNALTELAYYYRSARDALVSLGPVASTPSGSVLSASPCTRLQAQIPAQTEYGSFVIVDFAASYPTENAAIEVGVTKDFLGQTPSTWTIDVPDLTRPDGSCLLPSNPASWSIYDTPQDGRIALYLGGKGRDGEVRRWSTAFLP
jgi:hypothetical protein